MAPLSILALAAEGKIQNPEARPQNFLYPLARDSGRLPLCPRRPLGVGQERRRFGMDSERVGCMKAPRYVTALALCLFLAGCGSMNAVNQMLARSRSAPFAHPKSDAPPTPSLRIPANAVASAQDIPLVPVPPIPLGQGAAPTPQDGPHPNLPQAPMPPPPPVPGSAASSVTPASAEATPAAPMAAADLEAPAGGSLRKMQQEAAAWYAGVDSYIVRLTRREQVNGTAKPEEVMMFKFRKDPFSVHMIWVGKVAHDREVLYVKGQLENKIHTRLAAGDAPLMPAGFQMALPVDSILVRSGSRHSITEAGLGSCIERLGAQLDAQERGDKSRGVLTDLGYQKRPEFPRPVRTAEVTIPPGLEADLPNGGRRLFFFEPKQNISLLLLTYDDKNQEVEYYFYDRLIAPAALDANDFNLDRLWSNGKTPAKP